MPVKPIPDGFHTVTPYLVVDGINKLITFLERAFDAELLHGTKGPDGGYAHVTFQIGDSRVMAGQARGESKPHPATLYLYVTDADASYQRAIKAGATSIVAPMDMPYGDRSGGVTDPCGNMWWVATHKEDVSNEEIERRMSAAFGKK